MINDKDKAFLAKKLATIDRDSPVEVTLEDTEKKDIDYEKLRELYERLGFKKFLAELNSSADAQGENTGVEQYEYVELT